MPDTDRISAWWRPNTASIQSEIASETLVPLPSSPATGIQDIVAFGNRSLLSLGRNSLGTWMKTTSACLLAAAVSSLLLLNCAPARAASEKVLYSFCSHANCADGSYPIAAVTRIKGILYGTTSYGGANCTTGYPQGCGTVFSLDPKTGTETVLHSFNNDGSDGWDPAAGLTEVKGLLYGTTQSGGAYGGGTLFSIDPSTGAEIILHSFGFPPDGLTPAAGLLDVNGTLYGTTLTGDKGGGTIFSYGLSTGVEKVVYSFCSQENCADGEVPTAPLINVNGILYGTTSNGGAGNCNDLPCGTVFSFDPTSGVEMVLHSFDDNGVDGFSPRAAVIDEKGKLFGTTVEGGSGYSGDCGTNGCGTVFSVDVATGKENIVWSFCNQEFCPDGADPEAAFIELKGSLYSTTLVGGANGHGTVFSIKPKKGTESVTYSFGDGFDASEPNAGLIDQNKTMFGTTKYGGENNFGTVFSIDR
jgi:uncharacterized repeat protein (TIGR03803 family)